MGQPVRPSLNCEFCGLVIDGIGPFPRPGCQCLRCGVCGGLIKNGGCENGNTPGCLLKPVVRERYEVKFISGELAIECHLCEAPPSFSLGDVAHRFCAKCNLFLDTLEPRDTIHFPTGCLACTAYREGPTPQEQS